MKKIIFISLLLIGIIGIAQAKHVYIHKENGGFWGYNSVTYWENGADKWLDCCNPGREKCVIPRRPAPGEEGMDATDISQLYDLVDYAEDQVANERLTGSKIVRVHVLGENFDRLYKVTWEYVDQFNGETKSERLNDVHL